MEKVKPGWFPRGQSRDVGDGGMRKNKTSHHTEVPGEEAYNSINFPILGVIDTLYFADDPRNRSNAIANPKSTNVAFHDLLAKNQDEWLTRSIATTLHTGHRLEARVKVVMGPNGHVDSGTFLENVPLCISFGGAQNYGYVVPSPTNNTGRNGYRGTEDGDYCLIQFIAGNWASPIITNTWPSPLNTEDPPMIHEDVFAYARMAGTEVVINRKGDFVLDARNANEKTTVDPNDGVITKKSATGEDGIITLATRSDIYIAAGFPRKNESTDSFPAGSLIMRADKDVEIYSPKEVIDDDTGEILNLVDVQGPRGSLRRAARQHDRIKITQSDDGDLFEFLSALRVTIEGIGQALKVSLDPGAAGAGVLCETFANTYIAPTYQTGEITTGSAYCRIAGKGNASDIGFDESGIKNALGDSIPPEELQDTLVACIPEAAGVYAAKIAAEEAKGPALGALSSALKIAEKILEKVPGGQGPANIINTATPPLIGLVSTGGEIPGGATGEDLEDKSAEVSAANEGMLMLDNILSGLKSSWDLYDEGKTPPINPKRKDSLPVSFAPHPITNESVEFANWWYRQEDLDTPLSPFYFGKFDTLGDPVTPNAWTEIESIAKAAGEELADMLKPIVAEAAEIMKSLDKGLAYVLAVAAAGSAVAAFLPDDPVGSVKELDELTGGAFSESVNNCVNEKLE